MSSMCFTENGLAAVSIGMLLNLKALLDVIHFCYVASPFVSADSLVFSSYTVLAISHSSHIANLCF